MLLVSALFAPAVSFAALERVKSLLCSILGLLTLVTPIVVTLALVFFFWGVAQFILHSGDEKTRDDGKKKILWGIIALFVMFSIKGIISTVGNTLVITPDSFSQGVASCSSN